MSDYFHEQMIQKMLDAKPSTWLTDGLTEEEVKECIDNGKIKCAVIKALEDVRAEMEADIEFNKDKKGLVNLLGQGKMMAVQIIDRKIKEIEE